MRPAPRRPAPILICLTAAVLGVLPATSAAALDYDRNDVLGRELAVGAVVVPIDGSPLGMFVRGTARRHTRFLYFAGEALAGFTGRGVYGAVGGAVGGETADDAWAPLRGYGEFGVQMMYAGTDIFDALGFFVEGGMRYQVRAFDRPHLLLTIGTRVTNNFQRMGYAAQVGVAWTFD